MAWPNDQIDRAVRPTEAQRVKLEALQSAAAKAADVIKAACPSDTGDPAEPALRRLASGCKPCCALLRPSGRCSTISITH